MKIIMAIAFIFTLIGCAKKQVQRQPLTLYFSQEQRTLTSEQERKITHLLMIEQPLNHLTLLIAPTKHNDPFQALIGSQKRITTIVTIAQSFNTEVTQQYQPKQTANTVLLQYE